MTPIDYDKIGLRGQAGNGGHGLDVILDMVGGTYRQELRSRGAGRPHRQYRSLQGSRVEIDFVRLMTKRLSHMGSTMRAQSVAAKAVIAGAVEAAAWPSGHAGALPPLIRPAQRQATVQRARGRYALLLPVTSLRR